MGAANFIVMKTSSNRAGSAGGPRMRDISLLRFEARKGGDAAIEAAIHVLMTTNPGEWAEFMNGLRLCDINFSCLRRAGGCGLGSRCLCQDDEQGVQEIG